jgi:hypothetical protein
MKIEKARWSQTRRTDLDIEYVRVREGKDLYVGKVSGLETISNGDQGARNNQVHAAPSKQGILNQPMLEIALREGSLYASGAGVRVYGNDTLNLIRSIGVNEAYNRLRRGEGPGATARLTNPPQKAVYDDFVAGKWGWENVLRIYDDVAFDADCRPVEQGFCLGVDGRFGFLDGRYDLDLLLPHLDARDDIAFVDVRNSQIVERGQVEGNFQLPIWRPGLAVINEIFEAGVKPGWQEGEMQAAWPDGLTFPGYFWQQVLERDLLGLREAGIENEREAASAPGMGTR